MSKNDILSSDNQKRVSRKSKSQLKQYTKLLHIMLAAREAEKREAILFRQGKGTFHLPGAGHESIALLASHLKKGDLIFPHYRDRALLLTKGVSIFQLALDYFGKADASSGGTQMASHFYAPEYDVMPCASPTALQALPATGVAWAMKLQHEKNISICSIGEASSRQGEWFEALAFAIQENLPLLLIVEDNGYGVSTPTKHMTPFALGMIPESRLHMIQGWDILGMDKTLRTLCNNIRNGSGVQVLWMKCPRLMSHTSSDDQSIYRDEEEISLLQQEDPITALVNILLSEKAFSDTDLALIQKGIHTEVLNFYRQAEQATDPDAEVIAANTLLPLHSISSYQLDNSKEWNVVESVNHTLHQLFEAHPNTIMFGEDIADPKGGVFGLSKGLSTRFPDRVYNSPLAEATIAGLASGLALKGWLPIFEFQFIDFIAPALNQIMNQISTMRWRTGGRQSQPLVFLAPCGGYIAGAGAWHSQTNEAMFAHIPGLRVTMPSTPQDTANTLMHAANGKDPTLILLPKKQFFRMQALGPDEEYFNGSPIIIKPGRDITLVTWGNGIELCNEAEAKLQCQEISCEIVALRNLNPLPLQLIQHSISKTGRLAIIQEDCRQCSLGQAIIAELLTNVATWDSLYAPPVLISRENIHVPFNNSTALMTLPNVDAIYSSIFRTIF